MPTKTEKRATDELQRLEQAAREARDEAREARIRVEQYDLETERKRGELSELRHTDPEQFEEGHPVPVSKAAELTAEIKARVASPNPHHDEYLEARDRFHEADRVMRCFKVRHAPELLDEAVPDRQSAIAAIEEGLEQVREGIRREREIRHSMLAALKALGLSGGDLRSDPRVDELWTAIEGVGHEPFSPAYSRSLETPAGHVPLQVPNEDGTGFVMNR